MAFGSPLGAILAPVIGWRGLFVVVGVAGAGVLFLLRANRSAIAATTQPLGRAILTDCLFEEAPRSSLVPLGSEQKIDGVARLIHCPVKILRPLP
jgi:MFS family permease